MRRSAAVLLLCSALLAASPGVHAQGTLRVGLPAVPSTLDPHLAVMPVDVLIAREQFMGLTALDMNGRPGPGLAESWTLSPDALTYAFTLRDGLQWSDGKPLDAGVVVKSLERALDPAMPFAAQLLSIKHAEGFRLGTLTAGAKLGVSARDKRTVVIELAQPSQRVLHVLAQPLAAAVPVHRITAKQPWAVPGAVVGSGAYVMTADPARLERNEKFFAPAAFAAVQLGVFPALSDAAAAVGDGALDLALGFTPEPSARGAARPALQADALEVYQFIVNMSRAPLDRLELRHALGMVIDRAELITQLRLADAEPMFSMIAQPPYAPQRAPYARLSRPDRRIVAEALLLDTDIPAVRPLRLIHPRGDLHQAVAASAAASWRELGFKIDVAALAEAEHVEALMAGAFDLAVGPPWRQAAGIEPSLFIYGQAAGPWNVARYRELTFDQFIAEADAEPSAEFYPNFLRQAEGVLVEDQVAWPVMAFPAALTARAGLGGLAANAAHIHPLRLVRPATP